MPDISILPEILINKIAAGEVIERPASIVRELIDNSIDAGAKKISVEILHGGKKLIKIADDGSGMDRDDASLCFERHATSKIKSEDNLYNITTLGFRGEALSSIASVSKVILVTSPADSGIGTKVEFDVRHKKEVSDAPPLRGTTIEIRDVFYNTPARRKFLKSTPTELSHIIETVVQKAFAYPEIAFSLIHNDNELLNVTASAGLKHRFLQLYGDEFAGEFLDVTSVKESISFGEKSRGAGIDVYGFCSSPEFSRATRGNQFIFVNKRPVKNPTVSHAVYSAYKEMIPKDRHPSYFLFIDIEPAKVDVNVHPAKREVRFESSDEVHKLVFRAVKETLCPNPQKHAGYYEPPEYPKGQLSGRGTYESQFVRETPEYVYKTSGDVQPDFFKGRTAPVLHRYFNIGDVFVAEVTDDGIMIFDRHAVHERILYERFLKKLPLEVENLFLPLRIELPVREFNIVMNYKDLFHDFGFDIEDFGSNNVIVRSLPRDIGKADIKGLLMDAASGILEQETSGIQEPSQKGDLLQKVAAKLACHRSVRGRESLNDEELNRLIADLERTDMPDRCPHGRPTRILFSLDDLRKMFKRK